MAGDFIRLCRWPQDINNKVIHASIFIDGGITSGDFGTLNGIKRNTILELAEEIADKRVTSIRVFTAATNDTLDPISNISQEAELEPEEVVQIIEGLRAELAEIPEITFTEELSASEELSTLDELLKDFDTEPQQTISLSRKTADEILNLIQDAAQGTLTQTSIENALLNCVDRVEQFQFLRLLIDSDPSGKVKKILDID